MKTINRRTVLRFSGIAAATFALPKGIRVFADGSSTAPIAKTQYGSVSGVLEDRINVFRSIPYGADTAPVRFQPPLAPTPWTGVKACDTFTTRAPQLMAQRSPQPPLAAPS